MANQVVLTQEEFLKRCKKVHGDKYDYSKAVFKTYNRKVEIICPKHGSFFQIVNNHLTHKNDCKKCAKEKRISEEFKNEQDKFINLCKSKHNDYYNYNKTIYNGRFKNIIIECPVHGELTIEARKHMRGTGCKLCYPNNGNYSFSAWSSKITNNIAYFYMIECYNDYEHFIKIGITKFNDLKNRYNQKDKLPYHYNTILMISETPTFIWKLEKNCLNNLKNFRYQPLLKFGGSFKECFSISSSTEIVKILNNFQAKNCEF